MLYGGVISRAVLKARPGLILGTMYIFLHMVNKCERNKYFELHAISTQSSQFSTRWCQSARLAMLGKKKKNLRSRFESRFVNSEIYRIRTKYTNKKISLLSENLQRHTHERRNPEHDKPG